MAPRPGSREDERVRRGIVRTAVLLALVALGFYVAIILVTATGS